MCKVLVVEDELEAVGLYRTVLKAFSYEHYTARTMAEARKLIKDHKFAVAILDLFLDDGTGSELLSAPELASTIKIIITATTLSSEEKAEYIESGATYILLKPFNIRELQAILKKSEQLHDTITSVSISNDLAMEMVKTLKQVRRNLQVVNTTTAVV